MGQTVALRYSAAVGYTAAMGYITTVGYTAAVGTLLLWDPQRNIILYLTNTVTES
jgi:hypothetical protein